MSSYRTRPLCPVAQVDRRAQFDLPIQEGGTVHRVGWVSGCDRWLVSVNPPPAGEVFVPLYVHSRHCGYAIGYWLTVSPADIAPALRRIREWIALLDARAVPLEEILSGEGIDRDAGGQSVVETIAEVTAASGGILVADPGVLPRQGVH